MWAVPVIWSGLGLVGTYLLVSKSAETKRAIPIALFSLPHAIVFGPLFLMLTLAGRAQKVCPHCHSSIDRRASVCGHCTREVTPAD